MPNLLDCLLVQTGKEWYSIILKLVVCLLYRRTKIVYHDLLICARDNPPAKIRGLSHGTGEQSMVYITIICIQLIYIQT